MEISQVIEVVFKIIEFCLIGFALFFAWNLFLHSKNSGGGFSLKVSEYVELSVEPASVAIGAGQPAQTELVEAEKIPADYVFLNHISFLREEKQAEFQARTGLTGIPHYDIRVVVDSYYKGALDRVKYVEYFLHKSYEEPIQTRSQKQNRFLLKELANGEYVLQAKVYLRDRQEPFLLQRYITLSLDKNYIRI